MTLYTTKTQRAMAMAKRAALLFVDWLCGDISLTGHYR